MTETGPGPTEPPRLLLDEMHAPVVAQRLRQQGHDVVTVAEKPSLRAMTDGEIFVWAAEQRRRIVTENVKDLRRLLARSGQTGGSAASVLFTSSRLFPRVRRNPGPLIAALDAWLPSADAPRGWKRTGHDPPSDATSMRQAVIRIGVAPGRKGYSARVHSEDTHAPFAAALSAAGTCQLPSALATG